MKKALVIFLITLLLFTGCGADNDTTSRNDETIPPTTEVTIDSNENSETNGNDSTKGEQVLMKLQGGLDKIIGLRRSTVIGTTKAIEDTFVEAGKSADKNFGSSAELDLKAVIGTPDNYYREMLVKFDISEISQLEFERAMLELNCVLMESVLVPTQVNIYGCLPNAWNESTVTYNTLPQKDDFITNALVSELGVLHIDITDYVKKHIELGNQYVSFIITGDEGSVRRLKFSSKESETVPAIIVDNGFTTILEYNGENPWDYAMENVSDWLNRWEHIKQGGDESAETIKRYDGEYSLSVGATLSPDGENTEYTQYPTRTVKTLNGFTANADEGTIYDVYGGFVNDSMKQEATGFFYTKKIGDRWWTVDPLGYLYYRVGLVDISMGSEKQEKMLISKYGTVAGWAQGTTERLWELGFNAAGAWSSIDVLAKSEQPLSQTKILYILQQYADNKGYDISKSGSTTLIYDILPVFDPEFAVSVNSTVKKEVKGHETASYVYGWMSDNELPQTVRMLDNTLRLDATDARFSYSYATAWTFMYLKTGKTNVSFIDITDDLRREYRAMVYDRYFKIVCDALERYVPCHQFMGCRFLPECFNDEYVMRVAGYWCDVISINYYYVWEANTELLANQQKWAGKPIVVTEWYAKGMDVWEKDSRMTNKSGAGWTVKDQNDRGLFYQNYALKLLECKNCVGFDWFKYLDNDPDDYLADESNRNSNKGIMDNNGNEYSELVKYMVELNSQKYSLIEYFDER